jgi:hypothetical protein
MLDRIPDSGQLASIFSQATAPAFMLGAVAGFISILMSRLNGLLDRIRKLREGGGSQNGEHVARLKKRAILLNKAAHLALIAGMFTTLLLLVSFASAFANWQHVYGGGLLFMLSTGLLGFALFRFAQEVRVGLSDVEEFE